MFFENYDVFTEEEKNSSYMFQAVADDHNGAPVRLSMIALGMYQTKNGFESKTKIYHTTPEELPAALAHLEYIFQKIKETSPDDKETLKKLLFTFYWWSAQAMLDHRGSAAKSDLSLRALYLSKFGVYLPPWNYGSFPDVVAMKNKLDDFLGLVPQLMDITLELGKV